MSRVQLLATFISKIEETCQKIVEKTLELLKELADSDNEMVDEVAEQFPDIPVETILEVLREIAFPLSTDAETILKELPLFSELITEGDDILSDSGEKYPFLLEVWYGDAYEKDGIPGLQELLIDLTQQKETITDEKIVQRAIFILERQTS